MKAAVIAVLLVLCALYPLHPASAQSVSERSGSIGAGLASLLPVMSLASGVSSRLMGIVYQNAYALLDFIIVSFGYCTDLVSVLINVWGVVLSEIKLFEAVLKMFCSLCSTLPFVAELPSLIIAFCIDIPLACISILQSWGFLFLTLSSFIIDLLSRVRDLFPAPGGAI